MTDILMIVFNEHCCPLGFYSIYEFVTQKEGFSQWNFNKTGCWQMPEWKSSLLAG